MLPDTTIKRPALRYYGGKWRLAPWIISFFPEHKNYVEPCGGAASVLLQKPRSLLETYNDLDGNVVNFFRVLRDRPEELIRKIQLTPWARAEYELHYISDPDPVEMARRFFVGCWFSIGNTPYSSSGMRIVKNEDHSPGAIHSVMNLDEGTLYQVAERFRYILVENKPFEEIIKQYDYHNNLFYMDPPYLAETRTNSKQYLIEWSEQDHINAATLLHNVQGYVVISGYTCELYTRLYEIHGWQRFDKEAQTNSGGKRIESVWLSPRTFEALSLPKQMELF